MSILVTGGVGAIGSFVAKELVSRGERPVLFDTRLDDTLVKDFLGKAELVRGDILDLVSLVDTVRKFKVNLIIHTAAVLAGVAQMNMKLAFKVNCEGTLNVLEAARLENVSRVVYTSTKGTYGPALGVHGPPDYKPVTEDHPCNPKGIYGITKLLGEIYGLTYAQQYGLDFSIEVSRSLWTWKTVRKTRRTSSS